MNDYYSDSEYLRNRIWEVEDYFKRREQDMLDHIHRLETRIDYQESILNNPEELLSKISIADIEKFLRKVKLQNIPKNEL